MAERRGGTATEGPTAERRRRARREGEVAISADLTAALALAAVLGVLAVAAPMGVARLLGHFRGALGQAAVAVRAGGGGGVDRAALGGAGHAAFAVAVPLVLVPAAAAALAALMFGAVQTGGLFAWSAARPRWGRRSARAGLRRLFGLDSAGVTVRAVLKVALVVAVATPFLVGLGPALPRLVRANAAAVVTAAGQLSLQLAGRLVVALAAWGVIDWMLARWRHQRALAMTRDEVRRERRAREGDPQHRAERRRAHRALGLQAAPEDSRTADFVVVAPGPVAVAVAYDRAGGRAPIVVVTGRGAAADLMVSTARGAGVAVHQDATLAQALLATPAADEIPEACFEAVARLLP